MSYVHFALSTRIQSAERWSFLSPPTMSLSDFDEARPPMPTPPLDSDTDTDADFATTQTQCRLVRGQRQVKPRNRDRRPEYRPLIDGGANFQFKLLSLRDAQRRHSIVYRTLPDSRA